MLAELADAEGAVQALAVWRPAIDRRAPPLLLWIACVAVLVVGLALLFGGYLNRWLQSSVDELTAAATRVGRGDFDTTLRDDSGGAFPATATAFNRMTRDLRDARAELRRTERVAAWQEIAKSLAHELKNPLSPIRLSIETLRKDYEEARAALGDHLAELRQSAAERGLIHLEAAIAGAREMALPVTFSILTNMVAFMPLMFLPGVMGKIWRVIPMTVITVFAISWVEALLILPAHLSHDNAKEGNLVTRRLHRIQQTFSRGFIRFVNTVFAPFLDTCIRYRQITLAVGAAAFLVVGIMEGQGRAERFVRWVARKLRVDEDRVARALRQIGTRLEELISDPVIECWQ